VAIINEAMARSLGQGVSTGRQIYVQYSPHATMQVVGVVADVKQFGLDRNDMPEVYVPVTQAPRPAMDVALRTSSDPNAVVHAAAMAVHEFAKNQPLPRTVAMEAYLYAGLGDRRFLTLLLGFFDALVVVLAVIGVMAVVSWTVEQRTQEIGVRMALGAKKSDVMHMIVFGQAASSPASASPWASPARLELRGCWPANSTV
jgi:putative ABC transport system permease protein